MADLYIRRPTRQFRKDLWRLRKSGYDLSKLHAVIDMLAEGLGLPSHYRHHILRGDCEGIEECHIAPDWLFIFQRNEKELILILIRTGTHAQLLE